MVTSDFRTKVEIRPFRACTMHPAIIIGTVRSLWTWLWARYHVPQNVVSLSTLSVRRSARNKSHLSCYLTMAEISPSACRYSTILLLCAGSTRANSLEFLTAFAWSSGLRSSNSRPVNALPSVPSDSPNTPIRRQIASAVACCQANASASVHDTIQYKYKYEPDCLSIKGGPPWEQETQQGLKNPGFF